MAIPISYSKIEITPEEREVLTLLVTEGCTYDQAALKINRSREAVKQRLRRVREKFGFDSIYQVIAIAVSRGIIPAPSRPGSNDPKR